MFEKTIKILKNSKITIWLLELNSGGTDAVVEVYAKNEPEKKLKVIEDSKNLSIEFYRMAFPTRSKLSPELDKAVEKSFLNKAL